MGAGAWNSALEGVDGAWGEGAASPVELRRNLRDVAALETRSVEFVPARLALALAARDGGRSVRRTARDLVERHLALERIGQPDDHHAEVQEVGDAGEQRRFLAAVLR